MEEFNCIQLHRIIPLATVHRDNVIQYENRDTSFKLCCAYTVIKYREIQRNQTKSVGCSDNFSVKMFSQSATIEAEIMGRSLLSFFNAVDGLRFYEEHILFPERMRSPLSHRVRTVTDRRSVRGSARVVQMRFRW